MKTKSFVLLSLVGFVLSCVPKEREEAMQVTIDSLTTELQVNHNLAQIMTDVGVLIDSIDASRKALRTKMIEGTDYPNYLARMEDINAYVKRTEKRINELETSAKRTRDAAYPAAIKKLKEDLEKRSLELAALEEQVKLYKDQTDTLVRTVSLQKAELEDKLNQIKVKQEETTKLEDQVKQLLVQSKLDEGEAYFARAVAVEETARRTQFARKKKKSSLNEALELYKMAKFYGKNEAEPKVAELEKKLKKT